MKLADVVFNWLTINIVADGRKDDRAAWETKEFFEEILTEQFQVEDKVVQETDSYYVVNVFCRGENYEFQFSKQLADNMLHQIQERPDHYKNYSESDLSS